MDGISRPGEIDPDDAERVQRVQFRRLGNAVLVAIGPDPELGPTGVSLVKDAVMVGVKYLTHGIEIRRCARRSEREINFLGLIDHAVRPGLTVGSKIDG